MFNIMHDDWTGAGGNYVYCARGGTSAYSAVTNENVDLQAGTWYFITCVYEEGQPTRVYVDGTDVESSGSSLSGARTTASDGAYIGGSVYNGSYNGRLPDGTLDHVTLFNYAFSAGEVLTLYNSGSPLPYTAPASQSTSDVYNIGMAGTTTCTTNSSGTECVSVQSDPLATADFTVSLGLAMLLSLMVISMVAYVFHTRK